MKISTKQYATALYEIIAEQPQSALPDLVANFIKVLTKNNDLKKLDDIVNTFSEIEQTASGCLQAELISRHQISSELLTKITEHVKKEAKCQTIDWNIKTDDSIIGGLLIKYRDQIIDGSVKNNLLRLKNKLVN